MFKRMLALVLALGIVLSMGCAYADMSLYDVWFEYTWDVPEHTSIKKTDGKNNGRYVDGQWVGEVTNSMMDLWPETDGDTTEKALEAWLRGTVSVEQPFLEVLVDDIDNVDAEIMTSEFYELYRGRELYMLMELYALDVDLDTPYGEESYSVLCCVTMDYEYEQNAKYIVTYGDLDALGGVRGIATSNYIGDMFVVACDEWVSLRAQPSKSAERMAKVPLGAHVEDGFMASNGFVMCTYDGMQGFILQEYLELDTN